MSTFRAYQQLAKSGIVALVLISVLGGFALLSPPGESFAWERLAFTFFGVLFLASGSSALNQLQEWRDDARMPRTAARPLPSGVLTKKQAALFVAIGIVAGLLLLSQVSPQVVALGLLALLFYNGFYTLWWKRKWAYAAIPGAIPGAIPILIGAVAAQGSLVHKGAWYLFGLLFLWQMPHFWVLALKYREDYAQGGFPTLPVAHSRGVTVTQITLWCLAYVALALSAPWFLDMSREATRIYIILAALLSLKLLAKLSEFREAPESKAWLQFFLWINFTLMGYLLAAAVPTYLGMLFG